MSLGTLALTVFLLNLPFGWWRSGTPAYSARWMLAVHLPVPFIILLRKFSGLGWNAAPYLVAAAAAGQLLGGKLRGPAGR